MRKHERVTDPSRWLPQANNQPIHISCLAMLAGLCTCRPSCIECIAHCHDESQSQWDSSRKCTTHTLQDRWQHVHKPASTTRQVNLHEACNHATGAFTPLTKTNPCLHATWSTTSSRMSESCRLRVLHMLPSPSAAGSSFQSQNVYFNSETSSPHWKSKLKNAGGQ